jgi:hypothetical protein
MNLENWKSQARDHWKEFQPTAFKHLVQTKTLQKALDEAAEMTFQEMRMSNRFQLRPLFAPNTNPSRRENLR